MSDFKVGDKVVHKEHKHYGEMKVLSIFQHPINGEYLVLYNRGCDLHFRPADRYELVPDPMVARREAYIEFYKARYPSVSALFLQYVKEGLQDTAVDEVYDAIVATKHLFT